MNIPMHFNMNIQRTCMLQYNIFLHVSKSVHFSQIIKSFKLYLFVVHLLNNVHVISMSISHNNCFSWYLYSLVGKTGGHIGNLPIVNTSLQRTLLFGPKGVHYREVLLYMYIYIYSQLKKKPSLSQMQNFFPVKVVH